MSTLIWRYVPAEFIEKDLSLAQLCLNKVRRVSDAGEALDEVNKAIVALYGVRDVLAKAVESDD